ncbi:DUF4041 domain-containing protein [Actinomycetospora sp. C-140]
MEAEYAQLEARAQAAEAELARQRFEAGREIHRLHGQIGALQNKDAAAIEQEVRAAGNHLHQLRGELAKASQARQQEEARVQSARGEVERAQHAAHQHVAEAQTAAQARLAEAAHEADGIVAAARARAADLVGQAEREARQKYSELAQVERQVVATEDVAMLQQAGVYEFRHRLDDAVAYKSQLEHLKEAIKTLVRRDAAILSATSWTVNGSSTEGKKMVRDFSKLMLRAYNAEADNCVRTMKPHRLTSSIERLTKARDQIAKLGATMHIRIDAGYHSVRVQELELTADYLAKQDEEKERQRAERERQRDEEAARKEFEREKARLAKERAHWERVQSKWQAAGEDAKFAEAQDKLDQIDEAIAGVEAREANVRTGWVYVISNIGAFGSDMVKIGLTRRLDPHERVRELGDASVPFKFDIHALVFSEDAVGLETVLHRELADKRVNQVNMRREFFRVSPTEVRTLLEQVYTGHHLLEFTETAEAPEWRASTATRHGAPAASDPAVA